MKKALSLFLAFIMIFGIVVVGISEAPHFHAEAAQSTFLENNFYYTVSDGKATVVDYADTLSTDGIIIPERRSASLNMTVAKSASGALEYMKVARVTNIANTIDYLKEKITKNLMA